MKLNQIKSLNGVFMQAIKSNLKLGAAEAPKYVQQVKEEVLYKKVSELNSWYTKVLGLDEVRLYQERVVTLQEKLLNVQEKRRSIGHQLTEIRKKSNDLQDQIHKVKRQDNLQRFLDLMKEETEILKAEREITNSFNECDREEREVFTAFTNAVRDSHEKQRAQLEYTKYFGLILSLVGSFLTFCYSTLKKRDLKRFVEEQMMMIASGSSQPLLKLLQENQEQLYKVVEYIDDNPQVISVIKKSQKELIKELKQAKKRNNKPSSISYIDYLRHDSDGQKIIVYGCAAFVGFVILRAFFS